MQISGLKYSEGLRFTMHHIGTKLATVGIARLFGGAALLILFSNEHAARAETFVTPLPQLLGSYSLAGGPGMPAPFSFGMRFSEIISMSVLWAANATELCLCCDGCPFGHGCGPGCAPVCSGDVSNMTLSVQDSTHGVQCYATGPAWFPSVVGFSSGTVTLCNPSQQKPLSGKGELIGIVNSWGCGDGNLDWSGGVTELTMAFLIVEGQPLVQGDMNDDGRANAFDIRTFTDTLTNPSSSTLRARLAADCNFDDVVDTNDITFFIAIVLSGAF